MRDLHVLVVEDDPLILMSAVDRFRSAGLCVAQAINADEASALLATMADRFDFVFSDIETPGSINGLDLARSIRSAWPWLRVILTSGRLSPSINQRPADVLFFAKPYDIDQIIAAMLSKG